MPSLFKQVDRKLDIRLRSGQRYIPDFNPPRGGREGNFANDLESQTSFKVNFTSNDGNGGLTVAPTMGTGAATFTRATAAAARLESGLWNLNVASGTPRAHYLDTLAYGGFLCEAAATQVITNPRDLTQAAWVKVNMTTAQTSTGLEGAANSCTRLTCVVGNDTCLQTAAIAATQHTFSAYVKRVTGAGVITLNCGGGSLDITALINSSTFTLVQLTDSTLNAAVGFTIATAADAIDVDCAQLETGGFATTPIPAAGTRNADALSYVFAGNASASVGTVYAEALSEWATSDATTAPILVAYDAATTQIFKNLVATASTAITTLDSTNTVTKSGISTYNNIMKKFAIGFSGVTLSITGGGLAVQTGTFDGTYGSTAIYVGNSNGTNQWQGVIRSVKIWPFRLTDTQLTTLAT